ncbi:ArsR/SmtB family transcription factor [Mediterraneibacter sp. ICN-202921]|uniref:ArsR/SmtB family transcription factor n=1 Tax=Mediterraneibacter sp. ICN-202921 TaxID=3134657 RepID=UPI0030C27EF6
MDRIEVEHCDHIHVHKDIVKNVQEHMPREEELRDLADFFKVFGDTTRIRILCTLFQTEMCVCDLAQTLDMTQSAISHQLRILKQMKLVVNRREGKTVFYSLADGHIKTIMDQGMEHIRE